MTARFDCAGQRTDSTYVREAMARYNEEQSRVIALSALLRLLQVCCDPCLLDDLPDPPESAKLCTVLELIQPLRVDDRNILIFSQFTPMLELIEGAFDKAGFEYAVLTVDTSDHATPARRFQSGDVPILLASLKAVGVGPNLTATDAVIHYEPWWNPAVDEEEQAIDRAHRIGHDRPAFVYKLPCEGAIEERAEALKRNKSDLANVVLHLSPASTKTHFPNCSIRHLGRKSSTLLTKADPHAYYLYRCARSSRLTRQSYA